MKFSILNSTVHAVEFFSTAVVAVLVAAFFSPVLLEDKSVACRDVANFYYPLYEYTHSEMVAGRLPLWMPYENIGQPLAACPTGGVFYPVRLILFLPLDFRLKFHLFVVFHVVLATGTMFLLSSHLRCSQAASLYGAIGYSFGGIVLFQHTNIPFLIGAAWLPAVVLTAMKMVRGPWFHAIACGMFMAMMILAGDVETVCNFLLVAGMISIATVMTIAAASVRRLRMVATGPPQHTVAVGGGEHSEPRISERGTSYLPFVGTYGACRCRLHSLATAGVFFFGNVAIALLTAAGLSAVLILPAIEFGLSSDRVLNTVSDTLTEGRYHFGTSPWQWVELFVPNFYGRPFPQYSHWISWLTADDTYWVPTLYMGAITPILAGMAVCTIFRTIFRKHRNIHPMIQFTDMCLPQRHREHRDDWVLVMCVVFLLGLFFATPTGYYLLSQVVPGYSLFRYPGKWLVFMAMALNLLAAKGFDEIISPVHRLMVQRSNLNKPKVSIYSASVRRLRMVATDTTTGLSRAAFLRKAAREERRWAHHIYHSRTPNGVQRKFYPSLATIILLFCGVLCLLSCFPIGSSDFWNTVATHIVPSTVFGPFQKNLAQSYCITGLLHSGIVVTLFVLGNWYFNGSRKWRRYSVAVTGFDGPHGTDHCALFLPKGFRLPACPRFVWPMFVILLLATDIYVANHWTVPVFSYSPTNAGGSLNPSLTLGANAPKSPFFDAPQYMDQKIPLRVYRHPNWYPHEFVESSSPKRFQEVMDWNTATMSPKWNLRHRVNLVQVAGTFRCSDYTEWFRQQAKETSGETVLQTLGVQGTLSSDVTCLPPRERTWIQDDEGTITTDVPRIVRYEPERVVIDVCLTKSGVLVLSDQYYPGWQATVQYREEEYDDNAENVCQTPIIRVQQVFRGVELREPGWYRVTFEYCPWSFYIGLAITCVTLSVLLVVASRRFSNEIQ